jgi:hypothetical protein
MEAGQFIQAIIAAILIGIFLSSSCLCQVIITTNNVLVMNPEDENVLPFITELKMKISQPSGLAGRGCGMVVCGC